MDEKHGSSCWADKFPIVCIFPSSWSSCEWVGVDFGASCEPPLSPVFACLHYDTSLPLMWVLPLIKEGIPIISRRANDNRLKPLPKREALHLLIFLLVHYLMLLWKTQSASGNEILETIKAAPQSTYPDELVVIHATHVLYSRNGKWRDLRKDFGKMIMYIRIHIPGDWRKSTRIVWPEFFPCWSKSVQQNMLSTVRWTCRE